MKADPERWRKILKGMPVGNHTRSHRNLVEASDLIVRKQIKQNEALHERILGRPMLKVFRPPYGAYDERVQRIAADLGYKQVVLWNLSAADTSPKATVETITRRLGNAKPGSIILMHCARDITAEALPQLIRRYQERGIDLVGLDELLGLDGKRQPKRKQRTTAGVQEVSSTSLAGALERLAEDAVEAVLYVVDQVTYEAQ
jgi:peptidoglycan/xylan/chitin deacetylase (PgdA/CDA1 family)